MTIAQMLNARFNPVRGWFRQSLAGDIPGPGELRDDINTHLMIGSAAVLFLIVGLGGWAATSNLSGAVVAQGTVVVDSNVKKVQHPTGGVVGEVRVTDGDKVKTGDLVIRLDDTVTRANLGVITTQLDELTVRQARLKAERDGADTVELQASIISRVDEPTVRLSGLYPRVG